MFSFRSFAVISFYSFVLLTCGTAGLDVPSAQLAGHAAGFGMGGSFVLWWLCDSNARRVAVPRMSLWIGFAWYVVGPVYYISTRGFSRVGKLALHAVCALIVAIGGFALGSRWNEALRARLNGEDARLAQLFQFDERVLARARQLGGFIEPFHAEEFGLPETTLGGFRFAVEDDETAALRELQQELGQDGVAFVCDHGAEGAVIVAVLHARTPLELLRAFKIGAPRYGVSHEQLMSRVESWNARVGIHVEAVTRRSLQLGFRSLPAEPRSLVSEIEALCAPCIAHYGASVDELAAWLVEDPTIELLLE